MNKINSKTIYKTVRGVIVLSIAFFALTENAFAAPALTPVSATHITGTSATLVGHVSNPYKNSTVWIEWGSGSNVNNPTVVAVQGIWGEGTFEWNLRDLTPGQTYTYRSVATEGGVTVYSPASSFVATVPVISSPTVITEQTVSSVISKPAVKAESPKTTPVAEQATVKKNAEPVATIPTEGFTNRGGAAVIGAGDGIFPTTLIGWMALIVAILVMVIIAHMVYEAPEKRKRALAKRSQDEEEDPKHK